ncbi:hypothetical protein H4S14_001397 [Agrobacterium vitis]|nr:hypothetical protein [Agrobacterium vitis]MBE1437659.1 hypothetical protein [Agrobacterium vitis]
MGMAFGILVFGTIIGISWYFSRLSERESRRDVSDVGLAIMEFGRAFPNEALRSLHTTADGKAVFARLHDNRTGFMRNMRGHYACHVIEKGRIQAQLLSHGTGLHVAFADFPQHSDDYMFSSADEAAEVSLWMLSNYLSEDDLKDAGTPDEKL